MQDVVNGYNLSENSITLPSISALQNNTTLTGGYVNINNIGFYFGDPTLTGLAAKSDNSIVVDKNGTRWIFQPQIIPNLSSTNIFPTGITVPAGQTIDNAGTYTGTPLITSITAGSNMTVTNPTAPGPATVDLISSPTLTGVLSANAGITVPAGQTIDNAGTYTGTPIVTSIINGGGISVTNPAAPGPATISKVVNYAYLGYQATTYVTTSTTAVSAGWSLTITPQNTGKVKLTVNLNENNNTANDICYSIINLVQSSTGVAAGAAVTSNIGYFTTYSNPATAFWGTVPINYLFTGLTIGLPYSFTIGAYVSAGTGTFQLNSFLVEEY
jgi:hypothetical protein